jgi:uncharacterized protein DUF1559
VKYAPNTLWFGGTPASYYNDQALKSQHVGGIHALMGDGTVRFLSENINLQTYKYLADKADGQTLGEF